MRARSGGCADAGFMEGSVIQSGLFGVMVVGGRSEHFVGARQLSAIHHKIFTQSGFTRGHSESLLPSLYVIDADASYATS